MRQYAGNARKIWNLALHRHQENHAKGEKYTNEFGMNQWLTGWKAEFPYLVESPSQTLQQVNKHLHTAFNKFFRNKAEFPKPKKKGRSGDSFRFPQGFEIDPANSRIKLPKLGWIKYRNSREIIGKAKVTKIHIDIGNARKDYLHKASHTISKNHAVVCVEALQIGNMSKSSKGHAEAPGRNVRAKSGLNKSILDILSRGIEKLRDEGQDTNDASFGCESTARIACEVSGAVRPPAAGTHRSDLTTTAQCRV
jgi:transposase